MRNLAFFLLALTPVVLAGSAEADVVHPMPITCPRGTTVGMSHSGSYCIPPMRADCPPGYEPRVSDSTSYCEAPPPKPCPKGMFWSSGEPGKGGCTLQPSCDVVGKACQPGTCQSLSFCMEEKDMGRYSMWVGYGACKTQADCKGFPGTQCKARLTCDDPDSRKHEAARIEAAKKVSPSSVPEPYVATFIGGAPPKYPILRDGQKRPPLPDVPMPPDDDPPAPTPTSAPPEPSASAPMNAPTSAPSASAAPTNVAPVNSSPNPTLAPKAQEGGGCAGCEVGASRSDLTLAGLTSLVGLGIALYRRKRERASS